MSPEEIKQLRKDLNLTARQLAENIKAETEDVWAWETGERFPTKRFVTKMQSLKKAGAAKPRSAAAPKADTPAKHTAGLARLADPLLWEIVRKLLEHPNLLAKVVDLAKNYPDPVQAGSSALPKA